MKKIIITFLITLPLCATNIELDFHVIDANFFYPKNETGEAGYIVADQLYIKSPDVIISVDPTKEILDAQLILDSNYLFFDTPYVKIAAGIGNLGPLYQDINNLIINDTYFIYNDNQILLSTNELELSYGKAFIGASNTILQCDNFSNKKSYTKETAFVDCLNRARISTRDLNKGSSKINIKIDYYDLHIDLNKALIQAGGFHLNSNEINLSKDKDKYIFQGIEAYCKKEEDFIKLMPTAFINGCFQESYITLSNFIMETPKTSIHSKVELINIAGSRLRLSLPETIIKSNDDITKINNLRIGCKSLINKTEDLTIENFINGCLESATFNATSLSSASVVRKELAQQELIQNGTTKQIKEVQKNSKGFGIEDFSLLELSSKNNKIILLGKVKLLFLNPEFKITSVASFDHVESQIIIDVDKVLIAGFIPVKKLVLYLLKKFIPEQNILIDGETIKVKI